MRKKQELGKMLPLGSDVAFRELLRSKRIRRYFVSDVLGISLDEIRKVQLDNTFPSRCSRQIKQRIPDIRVLLNDGRIININLQIKECVVISILGFKWDDSSDSRKVYRFMDDEGRLYSDQFEIHVIEPDKELTGERLDDWIRLFRVENIEGLEMLQSVNPGVMEAVKEVMKII